LYSTVVLDTGGRFGVVEEEEEEEEGKTRWEKIDIERKRDRGQKGVQGEERSLHYKVHHPCHTYHP
jgi:hypothetical protein